MPPCASGGAKPSLRPLADLQGDGWSRAPPHTLCIDTETFGPFLMV